MVMALEKHRIRTLDLPGVTTDPRPAESKQLKTKVEHLKGLAVLQMGLELGPDYIP